MTAYTESGFEALSSDDSRLRVVTVPTQTHATRLTLRWGSGAFLIAHFMLAYDDEIDPIVGSTLDDWSYAYRAVRGYSSTVSDHADGMTVDLNALQHPLGKADTFTPAEHAHIERLLKHYDGALYWGGNYQHRKDGMHFGCQGTYAHLEQVARALLDTPRGNAVCKANPGLRAYVLS